MTPEGKVKAGITKLLKRHAPYVFYDMPVPGGYGKSTLDYVGWVCGRAFAIEAKAKGKLPTKRQETTIKEMMAAGAVVFVIDEVGAGQFLELQAFLEANRPNSTGFLS